MSQRLASRIEQDVASPLPWRSFVWKTVMVVVAGITLYLLFPSLAEVFDSFPKLTSLDPIWFIFAVALQVAHFTCTIALQRIALRTKAWFSVTTSQLSGNAISLIVPGGAAFGAATQFRMLAAAGNDPATAVAGLTAFSLLGIGGLLALPIFVLPAILAGTPIANGLQHAALLGLVAFVLFAGFGAVVLALDGPLRWAGRVIAGGAQPREAEVGAHDRPAGPARLRAQPHPAGPGPALEGGLLLSSGRLAFDFGTLLACVRATGVKPNPSLVLLAYAVAGLLALIPITPGGLGIVEAGLERVADSGRRARGRRRRGDAGVPHHLVLAAHSGGALRVSRLPAALREAGARRRGWGGRRRGSGAGAGLTRAASRRAGRGGCGAGSASASAVGHMGECTPHV